MGLTIKIPPESPLHRADDRSVALPAIAIVPTTENMPHVAKFEVDIVGSSTQAHQGEVYAIAQRLKLGYPGLEYRAGKEVALRQQMTVPLNRVRLEERVPAGARFTLTVQVWYYDSDAQGRPNSAAGVKGPAQCTSVLLLAPPKPVVAGVAQPVGQCRV